MLISCALYGIPDDSATNLLVTIKKRACDFSGAQFVIADFDRENVIDDKLYESMRSGDYWRRNPKANRLFLVLHDISAP